MILLGAIIVLIVVLIILKNKNKDIANTRSINIANKITYTICLISFVIFILNLGDVSKYQLMSAILFVVILLISLITLIIIQIIKYIRT